MINSIEDLINFRLNHKYKPEANPTDLGFNRTMVLNSIAAINPQAVALVWFAEKSEQGREWRLSYAAPRMVAKLEELKGISVPLHPNDNWDQALTTEAPLIKASISLLRKYVGTVHVLHQGPLSLKIPLSESLIDTGPKPTNIIGQLIYAEKVLRKLNQYELVALDIIQNRLSAIIQESRLYRLNMVSSLISQTIEERPTVDEILDESMSILRTKLGATSSAAYRLSGNDQPILMNSIGKIAPAHQTILGDLKDFLGTVNTDIFRVSVVPSAATTDCARIGESIQTPDLLYAPIYTSGRGFLSMTRFTALKEHNNELLRTKHCGHALVFVSKNSPDYMGDTFSSTDVGMTEAASHQIGGYLSSRLFESKFSELGTFFAALDSTSDIRRSEKRRELTNLIPEAIRVDVLSGVDFADEKEFMINDPELSEHLGPAFREAAKELTRDTRSDDNKSTIKPTMIQYICVNCLTGGWYLCFNLPTRHTINRFIVFSFATGTLPNTSWELLKYAVQEAHLKCRHEDAIQERANVLAQIRHAIIGPLTAASKFLAVVERRVARSRDSNADWAKLRTESRLHEQLSRALYLSTQARALADSARLLVKEITSRDIKNNGKVHVLRLLGEMRVALSHELIRKNLSWSINTNLQTESFIYGDKDLLWIAMYNIIDNAVKYSTPYTDISVTCMKNDSGFHFEVFNRGGFVSYRDRNNILSLYSRGRQQDPLNRRLGTGIGLAVTEKIIKAHHIGASLDFTSKKGETLSDATTRFWFDLPLKVQSQRQK